MKGATFEEVVFEHIDSLRNVNTEYGTCVRSLMIKFELSEQKAANYVAKYINKNEN
jgi:hypothetical protein